MAVVVIVSSGTGSVESVVWSSLVGVRGPVLPVPAGRPDVGGTPVCNDTRACMMGLYSKAKLRGRYMRDLSFGAAARGCKTATMDSGAYVHTYSRGTKTPRQQKVELPMLLYGTICPQQVIACLHSGSSMSGVCQIKMSFSLSPVPFSQLTSPHLG